MPAEGAKQFLCGGGASGRPGVGEAESSSDVQPGVRRFLVATKADKCSVSMHATKFRFVLVQYTRSMQWI